MDILTQGILGGVLAQSIAKSHQRKDATIIGIFSGLLADADILIASSSDPLLTLEFHRHFTHSIFFIPFGALIAASLIFYFFKNRLSYKETYLYAILGYCMSGLLDAFTSYGTNLLWPFDDSRISWNIISVVDPVFTLVLFVTLVLGYKYSSKRVIYPGLIFCSLYLVIGFVQNQRAENIAIKIASDRGHGIERLVVKPTLGNLLLWRSVYISDNRVFVDAIRPGIFSSDKIYQGENKELFKIDALKNINRDSLLYKDIQRFSYFSDTYTVMNNERNIIGDARYSMLPDSLNPLWGIEFNPNLPGQHVKFNFYRDNSQRVRKRFLKMVMGKEIN